MPSRMDRPMFRSSRLNARLAERDAALIDGTDRTWVHTMLLAWQRHDQVADRPKDRVFLKRYQALLQEMPTSMRERTVTERA